MAVNKDELRRLAALAGLRLDGKELGVDAGHLVDELGRILEHIETLKEADISQVEGPLHLPHGSVPPRSPELEPDRLEEGAPGDRAPEWRDGFFVVPRPPGLEGDG